MMFNENINFFVVYLTFLALEMSIYSAQKAQIALLIIKKVTIFKKYTNFLNIFSKKLAKILSTRTGINQYVIKQENNKQLFYGLIYSLGPIELQIFQTYIETNLVNNFI